MDDLLAGLTDALRSRLWAAFKQLDHKYRYKQIGFNECIREAYAVCRRELPHESAVALVVRYGRALGWLLAHRQARRPVTPAEPSPLELQERAVARMRGGSAYAKPGWMASPPSPDPVDEPIPEAEQRAAITKLVADLIQAETAPTPDTSPLGLLKRLLKRHGIGETVRRLNELLRPDHGVTRSTLLEWRASEEGKPVSRPLKPEKRAKIAEAIRRVPSAD